MTPQVLRTCAVSFCVAVTSLAWSAETNVAPSATPDGIRIKTAFVGAPPKNQDPFSLPDEHPKLIYASEDNRPLYTFAKDKRAKSTCVDECAVAWPPLLARSDATPSGDWSLIKRRDGRLKQWAFRGMPVYTFTKDVVPTESAPGPGGRKDISPLNRAVGDGLQDLWRVVALEFQPDKLPGDLSVAVVPMASGQVLVDSERRTLYTMTRPEVAKEPWIPVRAPMLANGVGEFGVLSRADGIHQWTMRGKALYRHQDDLVYGDANGRSADPRFEPAFVRRFFIPASVDIRPDALRGGLFVRKDTGQTLYTRDFAYVDPQGGHNNRGVRGDATAGEMIGAAGCTGECEKQWIPLRAPDDARPAGYWSLYVREDGTKQWAYQGYALYSMKEEQAGELSGHDVYAMTVAITSEAARPTSLGTFWRAVAP